MTIQTETSKVVYTADGQTKEFPVPFYFFANQVMVYQNFSDTPLIEQTDYIIKNQSNNLGGVVEFNTAPKAGDIITIIRNVELKQLITFLEGENFPAQDFEHALDKLTMGLQQLRECMSRAVLIPHGTALSKEEVFHCLEMLNNYWQIVISMPEYVSTLLNSKTEDVEEDNHKLITSAGVYSYAYDRETINDKITAIVRKFKNKEITISSSTVTSSTEITDYPYKYTLPLDGVTLNDCPVVMFKQEDATGGNFAPFAKTYEGGIELYVKNNDNYTTTIPLILIV